MWWYNTSPFATSALEGSESTLVKGKVHPRTGHEGTSGNRRIAPLLL